MSTGEIIHKLKSEMVLNEELPDSKTENEVVDNRRPNWKKPLNLGVL